MNQINKNRLIGGGVLVFAALLFAPAILTPQPRDLENPTLAVRIESDNGSKSLQVSASPKTQEPQQETNSQTPNIQLESVATQKNNRVNNTVTSPRPNKIPVVVATSNQLTVSAVPGRSKQGVTIKSTGKKASWLRVGSFSSKKNANNLFKQLRKQYGHLVKVEVSTVDGKTYHRVLVGPYNEEDKLQNVRLTLIKDGHNPRIQR